MQSGFNEAFEQRMGVVRLGFEFWMILHSNKPRMRCKFHNFYQATVRAGASDGHASVGEFFAIVRIEFIAMTMAFADFLLAIGCRCTCAWSYLRTAGRSQTHCAALVANPLLAFQKTDDSMCRVA